MAHYYEITVRVLADQELPNGIGLGDIAREITEGDWVGDWMIEQEESRELNADETYEMEIELGGDGGFFCTSGDE